MILHALVLGILNLLGVMLAFFLWRLLGGPQRHVQSLFAVLIAFSGFWLWLKFAVSRGLTLAQGNWEALGFWILSCLIPQAIFLPLHYFTQGYWTDPGNSIALGMLIVPVNFAAAGYMLRKAGVEGA